MDEETVLDHSKAQNQLGKKEVNEVNRNDKTAPKGKKKKTTSAKITVAAFAGGLAARVFSPMKVFPNASVEGLFDSDAHTEESESAPVASAHLVGHTMPIASEVNDSLGFNEAFAAARKETGPGGLFVWHGHTYGTYYKNEWDAMSQEEQDQYWADVQHTSQQIHYEEPEIESESVTDLEIEPDSELVEVEMDDESDVEVVIDDEIESDEIAEVEDDEAIEVSIDGDDEAEVLVDDVDEIDDIELSVDAEDEFLDELLPIDENEMLETDDEVDMPDDLLDNQEEECATENADIDDFASTSLDPEIEIENDMDMSDFS